MSHKDFALSWAWTIFGILTKCRLRLARAVDLVGEKQSPIGGRELARRIDGPPLPSFLDRRPSGALPPGRDSCLETGDRTMQMYEIDVD